MGQKNSRACRFILVLLLITNGGGLIHCGGGAGGAMSAPSAPPTLTSISPSSVEAGSSAFTLTISGSNFNSSCEVNWSLFNESLTALPTTFVSSSELRAEVPAATLTGIGWAGVSLLCPGSSNGTAGAAQFFITGFPDTEVDTAANDLLWDPVNQVIYLSVPPTVPGGNTIAVLDPVSATIVSTQQAGNDPDFLAISGDSQYLYAGLDGSSSVQRFILPNLQPDINYSVGPTNDFAFDIQVAPGAPHTTAISIGNSTLLSPEEEGVTIFDDNVARVESAPAFPGTGYSFSSLQWGSTPSVIYADNSAADSFDFYRLSVNSSGVTQVVDYPNVFDSFNDVDMETRNRLHYLSSTGLVYSDDRQVVNPATGTVVGQFVSTNSAATPAVTHMVPDTNLNAAFFLFFNNACDPGTETVCYTAESYDLTSFAYLNSFTMSNIQGNPIYMVRWGPNGLAFNTDTGQVYLANISTLLQAGPADAGQNNRRSTRAQSRRAQSPVLTTRGRALNWKRD
jgi:hypothetical protein